MTLVYYFLARDEERRMLNAHEATYRAYMDKTGMFLPRRIENFFAPSSAFGKSCLIDRIRRTHPWLRCPAPLLHDQHADDLDRRQECGGSRDPARGRVQDGPPDGGYPCASRVKKRIRDGKQYLVYFLPQNYIMQGMIADTGGDWKLYKQHHSISMITDWVFHPFRHLREGHHAMADGMHMQHQEMDQQGGGVVRRLIFLSIEEVPVKEPGDLFAINALRVPQFMVDVELHDLKLLEVKDLPREADGARCRRRYSDDEGNSFVRSLEFARSFREAGEGDFVSMKRGK